MDIQELLKEATKETLSEENLQKLQEAIESKAKSIAKKDFELRLESALAKQDTEYAEKLKVFLEDIDNDHTEKMEKLIEGLSQKNYGQLLKLVGKYKKEYITECKKFKDQLVTKVDKFFDIVVEEQVPKKELQEAVENVRSKVVLEKIARLIGVDKIQQNKLVKEGLTEAKSEMDKMKEEVEKLKNDKKKLLTEKVHGMRKEILAEKTQGLPRVKKEYINKVLGNKSLDFIKENFEYTLALFDEEDDANREVLKEQATKKTKTISEKVDRVEKEVVTEKVEQPKTGTEHYLSGFRDTF